MDANTTTNAKKVDAWFCFINSNGILGFWLMYKEDVREN